MSKKRYNTSDFEVHKCIETVNIPESYMTVSENMKIIILTNHLNVFSRLYARIMGYVGYIQVGAFDSDYPKEHYWMKNFVLFRYFQKIQSAKSDNKPKPWYSKAWRWVVGG